MPPVLALVLWFVLLLLLFWFDPAKEPDSSIAVWVPLIWIFIVATRLPAQWLGGYAGQSAQALEDGNPIDRSVFLLLIVLAIVILTMRSFNWGSFVTQNLFLVAYLSFALLSMVWSDFPFISFKRWFRDLGNYFVIFVVLSDPHPLEAMRTLLRRLSYLSIPLSVMLIKYYPEIGAQYEVWTGLKMLVGATTSKNMLGVLCLVTGIFFFWDTVGRWVHRKEKRTRRIILVNLVFIGMILWLLNLANSATSRVCLALGCFVIWAVQSKWGKRHSTLVKVLIPACFCLYLILAFGFNLSGELASQVGRDPTLTDRTLIWNTVLSFHTNPLFGTGYESFWLGSRLDKVWSVAGHVNEAHNGYLEVYLNLGLIGAALLIAFLIASYQHICKMVRLSDPLGSLNIALWTVMLFYKMTEAAFKSQLMWLVFLTASITIKKRPSISIEGSGAAESTKLLDGRRRMRRLEVVNQR
jgi:O-antigen ligase